MNERRDERWLDEQLRWAINTTAPEFNAETWKRDHAKAYQALVSRGQRARLTAVHQTDGFARRAAEAPWQMVTIISLLAAYARGGEDALDRQLDAALDVLGPWPDPQPMRLLFDDLEFWHMEGM